MAWGATYPLGFGSLAVCGTFRGHFEQLQEIWMSTPPDERPFQSVNGHQMDVNNRLHGNGETLQQAEIPKVYLVERKPPFFADIMKTENRIIVVSKRMRALIEELEPSVHFFFPIDFEFKNGNIIEGEFFIFSPQNYLNSLKYEECDIDKESSRPPKRYAFNDEFSKRSAKKMVLDEPKIQGLHVWRDKAVYSPDLFISDELQDEIVERDFKFFKRHRIGGE